jgi:hypothetical protein
MLLDGVRMLQRYLRLPYLAKAYQGQLLAAAADEQLFFQLFSVFVRPMKRRFWRKEMQ